jgi:hypothetical protein
MKHTLQRRPLAFEQMEPRLALSAAALSDYVFSLGSDLQVTIGSAGGTVAFEGVVTGAFGHTRGTLLNYGADNFTSDSFTWNNGFVNIIEGNFIFDGPAFAQPDVEGSTETDEVGSLVTPIPQPQLGDGEISEGIVAVAEIFRPTNSLASSREQPLVENETTETTVARVADDSWKSISLSRGRDMYFEVAALTDDRETSDGSSNADLSSKIAPLIYQQALLRREAERASSTTSEERANPSQPMPPLPAIPQQEAHPAESKHSEAPADNGAVEKTQRTAQDGEAAKVDEFSRVANRRDQVFAAWSSDDELSDEAIALRTDTQQSHSAAWPVLAALTATGWMARTRRSAGVLPRHRQPLPRK